MHLRVVALLGGLLASAFAWAATYFVLDLSEPFLALFPTSNSQQLFGLVAWHAFVGSAALGGLIALLSPTLGGIILLAAAGGWVAVAYFLFGFAPPLVVAPAGFAGLGALAAIAAVVSSIARSVSANRQDRPTLEDMAREDALRLEPDSDLRLAVERRAAAIASDRENQVEPPSQRDAIKIGVSRPVQERPAGLSGLFVANVTTLVLLTIAVAGLFYVNVRSGQVATAFTTLPFATEPTTPTPPAEVATVPDPVPVADPTKVASIEAADTSPLSSVPMAEVAVTSTPLDLAAIPPSSYVDPFAYCSAVKTIDFPDRRYVGPNLTGDIAKALNVPESSSPDRARWRCVDGALLGCASFRGASCALTPTMAEMRAYCEQNPNAQNLQAPNGSWSCIETTPEVPAGASWPVDARGFLPGAWVEITPPGKPIT